MIKFRFACHHLAGLTVITTPDPTKYIKLRGNSAGHCPKSANPNKKGGKKKTQPKDISKPFNPSEFSHFFTYMYTANNIFLSKYYIFDKVG